MRRLFGPDSPYRKRAKLLTSIWALLILFLCFLPAGDIPEVKVPLADKWVHFVLFGILAFGMLSSLKIRDPQHYLNVGLACLAFGWLIEELQGKLAFLGRSRDGNDILADGIGGLLGLLVFGLLAHYYSKKKTA